MMILFMIVYLLHSYRAYVVDFEEILPISAKINTYTPLDFVLLAANFKDREVN